ncbi:hypothetical protein LguiA_025585 [Lonicera macranthoides]
MGSSPSPSLYQYSNAAKVEEGEYDGDEEDNNVHDNIGRGIVSYEKTWMADMKSLEMDEDEDLQDTKDNDGIMVKMTPTTMMMKWTMRSKRRRSHWLKICKILKGRRTKR